MNTTKIPHDVPSRDANVLWRRGVCGLLLAAGLGAASVRAADPAPPGTLSDELTALAELPAWPIGFVPPNIEPPQPDKNGHIKAPLLAWVPPGCKHLRALFIIPNNTDSKPCSEHAAIRAVAAKHEMAIVYLRNGDIPQVQGILDTLADRTGIDEFRHAPWIPFGKSSRGRFPINMAWQYPERTIASISYHAETPPWPPSDKVLQSDETILHVNANGETEWGGTWFVHVRPSLLNYRANSAWLPHQVAAKGVGHGDYPDGHGSDGWGKACPGEVTCIQVWDYLAVFMDKALSLRVPHDRYPTDGPVKLLHVDESAGYVIDPFAIEDLFRQPHYPLIKKDGLYAVGDDAESPTSGYIAVSPSTVQPPEGVPLVALPVDRSPSEWLVTDALGFAMQHDPMTELGDFGALQPAPGDSIQVDNSTTTFKPIAPKAIGGKGGISLSGVKRWGKAITLFAYTVLDVPAPTRLKLQAPFSVAGRLQIVLNGVPVAHKQVVEFKKGYYPMLVVLRLDGPNWGGIDPFFVTVTDAEVAVARAYTAEQERRAAEQARILAEGIATRVPPVRPAADVPPDERKRMFWVADREQAEAWFKLHAIHGQKFE